MTQDPETRRAEGEADAAVPPPQAGAQGPAERPEVLVGAAFAGAFVFAKILKRLVG